jgi:hypothetical protein
MDSIVSPIHEKQAALTLALIPAKYRDRRITGYCGYIYPGSSFSPVRRALAELSSEAMRRDSDALTARASLAVASESGQKSAAQTREFTEARYRRIDAILIKLAADAPHPSQEKLAAAYLLDRTRPRLSIKRLTARISCLEKASKLTRRKN